ncbi:hypothetical protein FP568_01610 [Pandoraea pnomenusa]|nr:hypothetical protein FP568_01610 [Pandoraea pnomenusa]
MGKRAWGTSGAPRSGRRAPRRTGRRRHRPRQSRSRRPSPRPIRRRRNPRATARCRRLPRRAMPMARSTRRSGSTPCGRSSIRSPPRRRPPACRPRK